MKYLTRGFISSVRCMTHARECANGTKVHSGMTMWTVRVYQNPVRIIILFHIQSATLAVLFFIYIVPKSIQSVNEIGNRIPARNREVFALFWFVFNCIDLVLHAFTLNLKSARLIYSFSNEVICKGNKCARVHVENVLHENCKHPKSEPIMRFCRMFYIRFCVVSAVNSSSAFTQQGNTHHTWFYSSSTLCLFPLFLLLFCFLFLFAHFNGCAI